MDFTGAFLSEDKSILPLIDGIIGLLETVFPERIRAYYLTGNYAEGTAVFNSEDEADRLRQQLRNLIQRIPDYENMIMERCNFTAIEQLK